MQQLKRPKTYTRDLSLVKKNKTNNQKIFLLVEFYRITKEIKKEQMKYLIGRTCKAAKSILVMTDYNLDAARDIVLSASVYYNDKGLSWTLETVVKNFQQFYGFRKTGTFLSQRFSR